MIFYDNEVESILELIDIYYNETKHLQYMSNYRDTMLDSVKELLIMDDMDNDDLLYLLESQLEFYFYVNNIPEYSIFYYDNNENRMEQSSIENRIIDDKIEKLINIPIIEQRTSEWLEARHNMLSASNIYRAFKSQATIESLIRDKSTPLMQSYNPKKGLNNPMGWGTLFEPVSVSIYEYIYDTKIGLFGCIKHEKYDFIGASPDGINISKGDRFGKMLEIKNIYNRDITGIPMDEYWVQMQIQMEVCDLDSCDFLETRFCLYKTEDEFFESDNDFRGILLEIDGEFNYYYLWKYNGDIEEFILMIENEIDLNYDKDISIHYWYLDEFSCVLVKRNKEWFRAIFPYLKRTWELILDERKKISEGNGKKYIDKKKHNKLFVIKLDDDDE